MKIFLTLILSLFIFFQVKSQNDKMPELKEKFIIGLTGEFDQNKRYNKTFDLDNGNNQPIKQKITTQTSSYGIKIGFFVLKNFASGVEYTRNSHERKIDDEIDSSSKYYSISPFLRFYSPINIFVEGQTKFDYPIKPYVKRRTYQIGVGYPIFLNQNISVDIVGKYYYRKIQYNYPVDYDAGYYLTKGFTGNITFQFYL